LCQGTGRPERCKLNPLAGASANTSNWVRSTCRWVTSWPLVTPPSRASPRLGRAAVFLLDRLGPEAFGTAPSSSLPGYASAGCCKISAERRRKQLFRGGGEEQRPTRIKQIICLERWLLLVLGYIIHSRVD